MDETVTTGPGRYFCHNAQGPYANQKDIYSLLSRDMIEELFSMPLPDRYGRVLTLRADQGLYDDVHLMLIQAWLHLQMYEEYGALELLLRAQRMVIPDADCRIDERIMELKSWVRIMLNKSVCIAWSRPGEGFSHFSQQWTPVTNLLIPTDKALKLKLDGLISRWNELHQHINSSGENVVQADFNRFMAVQSSQFEGVFHLTAHSTARLARVGLATSAVQISKAGDVYASDDRDRIIDICQDYLKAINLIVDITASKEPITITELCKLHPMTLRHASIQKLWGEYALTPGGALRETVVTMPDIEDENAEVQFCPPHRVRHELQTLLDLYKHHMKKHGGPLTAYEALAIAAWLHVQLAAIHPFSDGNGRVCRLLSSIPLLMASMPPFAIDCDSARRARYFQGIREALRSGNLVPLMMVMVDYIEYSIEYILKNMSALEDTSEV